MRVGEILYSPKQFSEHHHMVLLETEVPVSKRENSASLSYKFYTGNNTKRILQAETLPSFIKSKLAMINSISKKDWNAFEDEFFVELDCYVGKKFTSENPEFEHIGWCVSDSIYVIVMSEHELFELKGISIDTREKSQAESKKNFKGT